MEPQFTVHITLDGVPVHAVCLVAAVQLPLADSKFTLSEIEICYISKYGY
jgi:hypothetical protein